MRISAPICVALMLLVALVPQAEAHSRGARPAYSGGDFPGEGNCTQCHTGSEINSGPGMLALMVGESAAEEASYTPGETMSLIISFEDSSAVRLGFQVTARSGDGCGPAGELATADTDAGNQIRILSGACGPTNQPVQWATHSFARAGQSTTYEVAWTAPAESVGPIMIAVAANGADGSGNVRGDNIYAVQATLEPAAVEPELGPPMISEGGVTMLGDAEEPLSTAAPGALAAISGMDFAVADMMHAGGIAEDGTWATVAGGVCVEVNQMRAPVLHVAADRILFQVPAGTAAGPAAVEVVRNCDSPMDGPQEVRSNVAMLDVADAQPALFHFSEAVPGLAALHADYSVVGEEGLELFAMPEAEGEMPMPPADAEDMAGDQMDAEMPPANPRPAMPGDVVTVLATGLGATEPMLTSGQIAMWPHTLAAESVKAMVGQLEVPAEDIAFAGAAAGFAGVYQVSFRVPAEAPAGDHPVSLLVDNMASPAGAMLAVAMPPMPEPEPMPDPMPEPMPDPGPGEGMDESPMCVEGMVLNPGDACVGEIYSTNLGAVIPGRFEVRESGEGCLEITGGAFQSLLPEPICAETRQDPLGAGLFIAERAEGTSTWTILTIVGPPEEQP